MQAVEKACWLLVALLWRNQVHALLDSSSTRLGGRRREEAIEFAKRVIAGANRLQATYCRVSVDLTFYSALT